MANVTIKDANYSVVVTNQAGTTIGTYTGQTAVNIMLYLENPYEDFITVANTAGVKTVINKDCMCTAVGTLTVTDKTFDDGSEPMFDGYATAHPIYPPVTPPPAG